jgi:ABC-type Fe3+ transport system permease subunit
VASNDPTDTGGLFIGRRPGTAPLRYRGTPVRAGQARRTADRALAAMLLAIETLLCLTLWGPQPIGWMWVGSQVNYETHSITVGIVSAFAGMLCTLFLTLAVARRVDHAWRLVRRAAGYEQKRGALERIFVVSAVVAGLGFVFWFLIIAGPGPQLAPSS